MKRKLWTLGATLWLAAGPVAAQNVYIQIEAQPSLSRAEDRVRDYASYLSDVNGFALGGGWYGVALGPFEPAEARQILSRLRSNGQVPGDSYVEEANRYRQRFFPVGSTVDAGAQAAQPSTDQSQEAAAEPQEPAEPVDETPRQARASEAELTRAEREQLQVALRWAGTYDGPIDAAFGQGTRNAMAGWQREAGFEATGVLTTRQRAELLRQYNAVLDGLGMEVVTDNRAGVRIAMPTDVVAFDTAASPFVRYAPTGDLPVRVLLISEPGDSRTLAGLYEIMQTLEIVPTEGERSRDSNSFTLTGQNDEIVSHTEARVADGAIKGFTLIWPAGDEERRTRVLAEMRSTFEPVPGTVLDPATVEEEEQAVDLVSGLAIRKPRVSASGFYVDDAGTVMTASDTVASCGRITLEGAYDAEVLAEDDGLGAALLRSGTRLAPREVAAFRTDAPRLKSEIAVAGYSFGGVLPGPTVTYGQLEDVRGLDGDDTLKRLALAAESGDAGGPVLDTGGAVLGMLLPEDRSGRELPDSVSFAAKAEALAAFADGAGIEIGQTRGEAAMAPEDLGAVASGMTVLVSCWD